MADKKVNLRIGTLLYNVTGNACSALSFFVVNRVSKAFGILTAGKNFKELGAHVMVRSEDLPAAGISRQHGFILIGFVAVTKVGSRRDLAIVQLDESAVNTEVVDNTITEGSGSASVIITVKSWARHSAVQPGSIVSTFLPERAYGIVQNVHFTGYSSNRWKGNDKIVCTFGEHARTRPFSVSEIGQLLVASTDDSGLNVTALGILWGRLDRDQLCFTSVEYLLDGLAIPGRAWGFMPPRSAANQSPILGLPESESSREDSDDETLIGDLLRSLGSLDIGIPNFVKYNNL